MAKNRRPLYTRPTLEEVAARETYVERITEGFILDGTHLTPPVRFALTEGEDVTVLHGNARAMIERILEVYKTAGRNDTTTPQQLAINVVRSQYKAAGIDVNNRSRKGNVKPEPTDEARAFTLAMTFVHEAVEWATTEARRSAAV